MATVESKGTLLTVPEVAARLRVHRNYVYALIARGKLPAFRLGYGRRSPLRISESELHAWLDEEAA